MEYVRGLGLNLRFINRRRRTALARAATDPESNPGNSLRTRRRATFRSQGGCWVIYSVLPAAA